MNGMNVMYKLLIVGDNFVGKTSITRRYVHGDFSKNMTTSIALDFLIKRLPETSVGAGETTLQIWDSVGGYRFGSMTPMYYRNTAGVMMVFTIGDEESFSSVLKWKTEISKILDDIPFVLIANKCDTTPLSKFKSKDEMDKFSEENGFINWFETSALKNINVEAAFKDLVKHIRANQPTVGTNSETIVLQRKPDNYRAGCFEC